MTKRRLRVLVVDDSAFMRKFIGDIIERDSELELAGTARNGEDALKKRELYQPDVITLDVEMPRLDGLSTLKKLMETNPLPVIMVSSHTRRGSDVTIEALAAGAVDFVTKPSLFQGESAAEIQKLLPEKIKAAAQARLLLRPAVVREEAAKKDYSLFIPHQKRPEPLLRQPRFVVAIGTSTGGPRALEEILRRLPWNLPAAVFITQHMPPGFTESLARRLDKVSPLKVLEAKGGERVREGYAYLAPGGYHLELKGDYTTFLSNAPPVQHVRPSADVMMESLAGVFGPATVGVILTGMGRDGLRGMARIKEKGGKTVVQDPATAVIPSMPQAVIREGVADEIIPLEKIADTLLRLLR